jgi:hypothetical protein
MMQCVRFPWCVEILVVNTMNVSKTRDSSLGLPGEDHAGALTDKLSRGTSYVAQGVVLIQHITLQRPRPYGSVPIVFDPGILGTQPFVSTNL